MAWFNVAMRSWLLLLLPLPFLGAYYGAWLPLRKAQQPAIVYAKIQSGKAFTPEGVVQIFDEALRYPTSFGNQELTQTFVAVVELFIEQAVPDGGAAARQLVEYIESKSSRYWHSSADLIQVARLYRRLWDTYHVEEDAQQTEKYYRMVLEFSPKSPLALTELQSLYRATGNREGEAEMAAKIKELYNYP